MKPLPQIILPLRFAPEKPFSIKFRTSRMPPAARFARTVIDGATVNRVFCDLPNGRHRRLGLI